MQHWEPIEINGTTMEMLYVGADAFSDTDNGYLKLRKKVDGKKFGIRHVVPAGVANDIEADVERRVAALKPFAEAFAQDWPNHYLPNDLYALTEES